MGPFFRLELVRKDDSYRPPELIWFVIKTNWSPRLDGGTSLNS